MDSWIERTFRKMMFFILFSAVILTPQLRANDNDDSQSQDCCFVHPNYQGVCVVQPAEGETCEEILLYLNTPATVGKTYCDNSRIRGGWEQVQCPENEEQPSGFPIPSPW